MVKTSRAQREALKRVYRRVVADHMQSDAVRLAQHINFHNARQVEVPKPMSYRTFRRTVQPGPDCIMVPFAGMWLGIERDGYTHS